MKKLLLLLALAGFSCPAFSQTTTYTYTYDAAGNRIKREAIILKSAQKNVNAKDVTDTLQNPENEYEEPSIEQLAQRELKVYPNPTRGQLKIELSGEQSTAPFLLQITDVRGRVLFEKKTQEFSYDADLSQYPSGIYVLVILVDGQKLDWKIVKQ